jgi:hypothetical protein
MRDGPSVLSVRVSLLGAVFLFGGWTAAGGLVPSSQCTLLPVALAVDSSSIGNSDGDGLLEPFETVAVGPSWQQKVTRKCIVVLGRTVCSGTVGSGDFPCSGNLTEKAPPGSLTGPIGGDYVVQGSALSYNFGIGGTSTGDYAIYVSAPTGRPAPHWDATFTENLAKSKSWTIHIGDSFWDVPRSNPFYKKVETLFHSGITAGCAPGAFCPNALLSRSDIAVFVARGLAKGGANIPVSGTIGDQSYNCAAGGASLFRDVAPTDAFCKHAHYLAVQNVTLGCSGNYFCPSAAVSRLEMAGFVAREMVAPAGGAAVPAAYGPDPVTGRSYSCSTTAPNIHFGDVPATDPYCKLAHYLWARGVIAGCTPTGYCATSSVTRGEMSKFLSNAAGLTLYGP